MALTRIKPSGIYTLGDYLVNGMNVTANLNSGNANLGNVAIANYFIGSGANLTSIPGANVTGAVAYATTANSVAVGNVSGIGNIATLNLDGNSSNILYGNGTFAAAPSGGGYGNSNVATFLASYGSNTITTTGNVSVGNIIGNGQALTGINGSNVTGQVGYAAVANSVSVSNVSGIGNIATVNLDGNASNILYGNGTFAAAPVTSYGNANVATFLASYGSNTITTTGNVSVGNIIGNGQALTGINGANVTGAVAYATTANSVAGANVTGAVSYATTANSVAGANVSGEVAYAATANSVAGANVSGQVGNALVAGTVYTAAQPNITSTGTLTSLSVSGNANVGNIGASEGVFTGNISANNLTTTNKVTAGNGLQVSAGTLTVTNGNLDVTGNINVTGNLNYSNVTDLVVGDPLIYIGANNTGDLYDLGIVASYNNGTYYHTGIARNATTDTWTFFDGVVAEPTTVIDWANATYPSVKLGNLQATGTLSAVGNANVGNIGATNGVFTNVSGNGANLSSITGANVTGAVAYATTANSVAGANVSGEVSYAATANSVAGANVSGQVGNALVAGTVYTASQPNITSVGILSSLSVSGNANVGNIGATNGVFTNVSGNGANLSSITGANVTGQVSFAATANSVAVANVSGIGNIATVNLDGNASNILYGNGVFAAAPAGGGYGNSNVATFLASYGSNTITTTGNVSVGNIIGNGQALTGINGANVTGEVAYAATANSVAGANVSGQVGNALVAGTVYTAAQPNITSVGTLTSLSVSGNLTAANLIGIFANGNSTIAIPSANGNINLNAGGSATPELVITTTGVNVNGTLSASGNANVGNIGATGVVATTVAGSLTTASQPNVTSVGTLTSLTVGPNSSVTLSGTSGYVKANSIYGNDGTAALYPYYGSVAGAVGIRTDLTVGASGTGNLVANTGKAIFGDPGNVVITGGTNGYVLSTDGAGNLSWAAAGSGSGPTITDNTSASTTYYPVYATATSGSMSVAGITTTKLQFVPSTGQLTVQDLNTLSDATLKENAEVIEDPFTILKQLFGMSFNWSETGKKSYGVLAQMLEKVLPELVSTNAQGVKTVNYIPIIAFLIEAVKKQQDDIEQLKKR